MVAITTTLIVLLNDRKVLPGAQVVLAKEVYPRVPNVYQRLGFKVVRVDSSDLRAISLAKGHAPKIIHLETIGNGFDLPVLDVEGLLSVCWRTEVTIIIDNTLATLELVNPFQTLNRLKQELGEPNFNLVYVESLSKYYRIDGCDSFTAGVVIAEDLLMDQVDQVMGDTGSYIPPASLQLMPASPQLAANEMIQELSSKAKMLVDWLRQQDWVKVIHYPRQPAGGVLFFQLEDSAKIRDFCDKLDLPKASSFGHDMATVFPYGLFFPEDLPGVIRLSLGVKEDTDSVIHKLDMAAQAVFK